MKPDTESEDAVSAGRHRRGVRLFVALHLGAFATIYALAVALGGGWAGPPMPPLAAASASPAAAAAPHRPRPGRETPASTQPTADLPAWAQRAEVSAPWESR